MREKFLCANDTNLSITVDTDRKMASVDINVSRLASLEDLYEMKNFVEEAIRFMETNK